MLAGNTPDASEPAPPLELVTWLRTPAAARWLVVARRAGTILLFAWFAWHTYDRISFFVDRQFPVGLDATIYYRGVVAWLAGTNPWDAAVVVGGFAYHYAGTPVTTVIMAPAALLSEEVFTIAWVVLTWVATIWTLRRLRFPLWWLLFPPIAEALFSANPQLVVLALLVANHSVASAVATMLKVYAFIPLFGEARWRQIALAVGFNAATIVVAPGLWLDYIRQFGEISSRLEYESLQGLSAFYFPVLLAVTVFALLILALRDRRAAGWLAVPAMWPSSQFHYSTMALPVMSPLMAVLLAIPHLRLPPVVIILEVARRLIQPWLVQQFLPEQSSPGPVEQAPGESPPPGDAMTLDFTQSRWKTSSRRWWKPVAGSVSGSISDAISACQRALTGLAAIDARNAAKSSTTR